MKKLLVTLAIGIAIAATAGVALGNPAFNSIPWVPFENPVVDPELGDVGMPEDLLKNPVVGGDFKDIDMPQGLFDDPIFGSDSSDSKNVDPSTPPERDMTREEARIEKAVINVAESHPPQYSLHVEFGLPNSCVQPGGYEVEQSGRTIDVGVWVLKPADKNVICAQVYGTAGYDIALGSDFQSGQTYTAVVNGREIAFTAQ